MEMMQWRNLFHGDNVVHMQAFQDGAMTPQLELAQVVVQFRMQSFGEFTPWGTRLVSPVHEITFPLPLAHFLLNLHPQQAYCHTISSMISQITFEDAWTAIDFWKESLSSFTFQAVQRAWHTGITSRLVVIVEIQIHDLSWIRPSQLVAEEIDEVLVLDADNIGGGGQFGGVPTSTTIEKLTTTLRYGGGEDSCGQKACVICIEDFEPGMEVMRMPCSHVFHGHCLTHWLERSHVCPLCRFELPSTKGGVTVAVAS